MDAGVVLRMSPPWTWSVVTIVAIAIVAALVFASLTSVEVTERARGITRSSGGVRPLIAQSDAVIAEVFVKSGARVQAGAPIARLRSVVNETALLEVEREIARASHARASAFSNVHYDRQRAEMVSRVDSAQQQLATAKQSQAHRERRLEAVQELHRAGLVSGIQAGDAREELLQATRSVQAAEETIARTKQELAALEAAHERELREAERALQEALARRAGLSLALQRALLVAPQDGIVETVLPRNGDYVQSGQVVARVIADSAAPVIVAFVAEKHVAAIHVGDRAAIELDRYPSLEFGSLPARVVRVAADLATREEIVEAMGEGNELRGPLYRVELELLPSEQRSRVTPGMLLDVRLTLRRQRLIAALLSPWRSAS